MLLKLNKKSI